MAQKRGPQEVFSGRERAEVAQKSPRWARQAERDMRREAVSADTAHALDQLRPDAPTLADFVEENGGVNFEKVLEHAHRLPVSMLFQLEKKQEGLMLRLFATERAAGEYNIDFRGNYAALKQIGAGNILPPSVRRIATIDTGGNERSSRERNGLRGDFYDEEFGYIEILDGYTLKIIEEVSQESERFLEYGDGDLDQKAIAEFLDTYEGGERQRLAGGKDRIMDEAVARGIDPALPLALRMMHAHESENRPFGIVSVPDALGFEAQLNWVLRTISHAQFQYEARFGEASKTDITYTKGFLLFVASRFDGGRRLDLENLTKYYEHFSGRDVWEDADELRRAEEYLQRRNLTPEQILGLYRKRPDERLKNATPNYDVFEEGEVLGSRRCAFYVSEVLGLRPPIPSAEGLFAHTVHNGGEIIEDMGALQAGDLIFFAGTYENGRTISHTGVMKSNDRMRHHGTFRGGVATVDIKGGDGSAYYQHHFYRAVRLPRG